MREKRVATGARKDHRLVLVQIAQARHVLSPVRCDALGLEPSLQGVLHDVSRSQWRIEASRQFGPKVRVPRAGGAGVDQHLVALALTCVSGPIVIADGIGATTDVECLVEALVEATVTMCRRL